VSEPTRTLKDQAWPGLLGFDEQGPYLIGGRCLACDAVAFGMRDICPRCWSSDGMRPTPIGRTGRLYSCTTIHQAPDGFAAPYLVGYVDLPEGVRAFAHIDAGVARPEIGEDVVLRIAPVRRSRDGGLLDGPVFASARANGDAT
jgi:uncharacterized OB-fold protein